MAVSDDLAPDRDRSLHSGSLLLVRLGGDAGAESRVQLLPDSRDADHPVRAHLGGIGEELRGIRTHVHGAGPAEGVPVSDVTLESMRERQIRDVPVPRGRG